MGQISEMAHEALISYMMFNPAGVETGICWAN